MPGTSAPRGEAFYYARFMYWYRGYTVDTIRRLPVRTFWALWAQIDLLRREETANRIRGSIGAAVQDPFEVAKKIEQGTT